VFSLLDRQNFLLVKHLYAGEDTLQHADLRAWMNRLLKQAAKLPQANGLVRVKLQLNRDGA
jgi:hypothetical protein